MAAKQFHRSNFRPRYDLERVRQAARGRWVDVIASVGGIPRELLSGGSGEHPCPKCGGNTRFRMIDVNAGAVFCSHCFNSRNGDGFAAVQWSTGLNFPDSLAKIAEFLHVQPESGKAYNPNDPAKDLEFRPWNESIVGIWCKLHKPGIAPHAILQVGGKLAVYSVPEVGQFTVIALPVWGQQLKKSKPVGWVLFAANGGKLPVKSKDSPVEWVKMKSTPGTQPGVIGIVRDGAKSGWKTEGPTDLLALISMADFAQDVTAFCNVMGSKEDPSKTPWIAHLFNGMAANIIHDCDEPGQLGSVGWTKQDGSFRPGWSQAVAGFATECRNVVLPFPIMPDRGQDLRDWCAAGHTWKELLTIRDKSPVIAKLPTVELRPIEADDDPHRLARVNLERYARFQNQATIRFWRNEWYTWKPDRGCYRLISEDELKAHLTKSIKQEFDRINLAAQAEATKDEPKPSYKVTRSLIQNVMLATASMTVVSDTVEPMTWLYADGRRQRRNLIAMTNGLIDLDALMRDAPPEEVIIPHSPEWFSMVRLPYKFDLSATCPKWEAFLEKNLEQDPERIKVLQEWAGYCLTPDTGFQKFLVLKGEGANGKSVYCAGLSAIVGLENCSHIPLEVFGDRFSKTATIGKLINICADVGEMDKAAEGYLKSFTSGDVMHFDRKGITGLDCVPTAKLMLACNNMPRFVDRSTGISRRMLPIPWNIAIADHERVLNMDKASWWERSGELPGMFLWAIRGLARLQAQGRFTLSLESQEALEDYQQEMNPARAFLLEYCERSDSSAIKSSKLYEIYSVWCQRSNYRPLSERQFGKEVKRVFPFMKRSYGGQKMSRYWKYENLTFSADEICGIETYNSEIF